MLGSPPGALAARGLAVEATADYDTQGADLVPQVKAPEEVVPRGLAAPVRPFGGFEFEAAITMTPRPQAGSKEAS